MIGQEDAGREPSGTSIPPEEAAELRSQIRYRLEAEFLRAGPAISSGSFPSEPAGGNSASALRKERRRILREEEDAFYAERGLYRYRNHRGEYEWLSKEDIERRRSRRQTDNNGWRDRIRSSARNGLVRDIANGVIVFGVIAAIVILFRREESPDANADRKADFAVMVRSEPEGAAIFVDGRAVDRTTNAQIAMHKPGRHVVRVVLPGYRAVPDSHVVQVRRPEEVVPVVFMLYQRANDASTDRGKGPATGTTRLMIDTAGSARRP